MLTASCKRIVRASWNLDVVDGARRVRRPNRLQLISPHRFSNPARGQSCRRPTCRPGSRGGGGGGGVLFPRWGRRAGPWFRSLDFPSPRAVLRGLHANRRPLAPLHFPLPPSRHPPDPAFRHSLRRKFRACLSRRSLDFLMDRLLFLKESIRVYHVELSVFQTGKFSLGLEMTPGYVIVLPAQLAQRFERAHLRDPWRPRVNPVWTGIF